MPPPISHPSTPTTTFPQSTSLPTLASPSPSYQQKNYHPYLIQSTSSSLLTRSNSSPAPPANYLGKHKSSRSMSSLAHKTQDQDGAQEEDRGGYTGTPTSRRSLDSPSRPMMLPRSGTFPSLPIESSSRDKLGSVVELPLDPKSWTPSELARYLAQTLRTGGIDGTSQVLPAPLVEDIKSWVLRHQVTGRKFIRGNSEGWTSSARPPPFLPLLLTISRRLRRASLQGRNTMDESPNAPGSVLMEEDELSESEMTGVRRMANALEARDSASEASGDEGPVPRLRPQWTGGSEKAEVWRRWQERDRDRVPSPHFSRRKPRRESLLSQGGMADAESSPSPEGRHLEAGSEDVEIVTPLLDAGAELDKGGTIRPTIRSASGSSEPPVEDKSIGFDELKKGETGFDELRKGETGLDILRKGEIGLDKLRKQESRTEVTPTPEKPTGIVAVTGLGLSTGDDDTSESEIVRKKGSYSTLRRPRPIPHRTESEDDDAVQSETSASRWTTARRVTIKPTSAQSVFAVPAREKQLQDELAKVLERVRELENKLADIDRPKAVAAVVPFSPTLGGILETFGLASRAPDEGDDALPRRIRELPGYLFLVGVGVGAVMVRVLLGRAR
ncbi:hypothetical protein BCR39DRAFT_545010 [Naematelia encephala]|uniref:Uncharacterized protein n=1 Tax=Naematelia encephala TaxID=71784 RepID=A0A1Y2ARI7_9TREE|nr:hypothetical protein BCR39DRAFT_545010 [Naematelia encephala]